MIVTAALIPPLPHTQGDWSGVLALGTQIQGDLVLMYHDEIEYQMRLAMSTACQYLQRWGDSVDVLQRAVAISEGMGEHRRHGHTLIFLARSHMGCGLATGESPEASACFEKARGLGAQLGDFTLESEACAGLADLASRCGRRAEAMEHATQAVAASKLELDDAPGKPLLQVMALHSMIRCSDETRIESDESLLHEYLALAGGMVGRGSVEHRSRAQYYLAKRHAHMNRRAEALAACRAVVAMSDEGGVEQQARDFRVRAAWAADFIARHGSLRALQSLAPHRRHGPR